MAKQDEEWETVGYITRRVPKLGLFWGIFGLLNLIAIVVFIGIFAWAAFDMKERFEYVLIAQIPPIVMMAIRRCSRL